MSAPDTTASSSSTVRCEEALDYLADLLPLPRESYPRLIKERKTDKGFFVAFFLILTVWMITPLSCLYLGWFTVFGPSISDRASLPATLSAVYSLAEVIFAIYHWYLVNHIQASAPPLDLPLESRVAIFRKILSAGISHRALSHKLCPTRDSTPDKYEYRTNHRDSQETTQRSRQGFRHDRRQNHKDTIRANRSARAKGSVVGEIEAVFDAFRGVGGSDAGSTQQQQVQLCAPYGEDAGDMRPIVDEMGPSTPLHFHDRKAVDFRERLRTWFDHAPWDSLRRQNLLIWLSWSCFNLPWEETRKNTQYVSYLESTMRILEARIGMEVPKGYDPDIPIIRLNLDPVNAKGRPLLLYTLSNGLNAWLTKVVYPYIGMTMCHEGEIDYLVRVPLGWTPEMGRSRRNCIPIVYLHGLGFGLMQSHLLVKHLIQSLPTHPLLIPISPYTSQSIFDHRHLRPWTRVKFVEIFQRICTQWGFWEASTGSMPAKGGLSVLSHSNGSVSHVLKDCPDLIRRNTFVDPVVFALWEGDICHSFCYRQPATALELLLCYFVASEIGIASYIQRHFDWADNTLFFENIPDGLDSERTAFFLGGKDIIIDAARTRHYLEEHGVTTPSLQWDSNGNHGDCLWSDSRHQVVMFVGTGKVGASAAWLNHGRHQHSTQKED